MSVLKLEVVNRIVSCFGFIPYKLGKGLSFHKLKLHQTLPVQSGANVLNCPVYAGKIDTLQVLAVDLSEEEQEYLLIVGVENGPIYCVWTDFYEGKFDFLIKGLWYGGSLLQLARVWSGAEEMVELGMTFSPWVEYKDYWELAVKALS